MTASSPSERRPYLDLLRVAAVFLVIVNHTNSELFRASAPSDALWWLSVTWFFVSKTAIPLFVMISGALLLGRNESYKKLFSRRILRIVIVLVVVSIPLYILDGGGSVGGFFAALWSGEISMPLWYLYMYLGLLLALPILRAFVRRAKPRDLWYFAAVWAVFVCVLPLVSSLGAPTVSKYLNPPAIFAEWVGFMVLGYALANTKELPRGAGVDIAAWACVLLPIAAAVLLTAQEQSLYGEITLRVERASLLTTALPAAAMFVLARRRVHPKHTKLLAAMSATTFGVYLAHIFLIRRSRPVFVFLAQFIGRFPAMLVYELCIFVVCTAAVWLVRKIPGVKKFI